MAILSSICLKCGVIAKSGKTSCCGRSGSWFGNCGSVGNVKLDHTWYEGIQACKTLAQPKTAIGRQSNAAQQRNSPNGSGMTKLKAFTTPANTFTFTAMATESISQGMCYALDVSTMTSRRNCMRCLTFWTFLFSCDGDYLDLFIVFLTLIALTATAFCCYYYSQHWWSVTAAAAPAEKSSSVMSHQLRMQKTYEYLCSHYV